MKIFYIILISLMCCEARANAYHFKCEEVSAYGIGMHYIFRCENDEVVCYTYRNSDGYLSCKFK